MNLILLGAPGAGKGTQAGIISEKYGIPAVSTGNVMREAIRRGTEVGRMAESYIDKGRLVPDDVVISIIRERLRQDDCKKGFILDGFPRTVPQAEALEKMGVPIGRVIEIHVSDERIVRRMSGRRVCEKCGETYHIVYKPSKDGVTCDRCGGRLVQRADDKPEIVLGRLEVYHRQTEPLKEFYAARHKLRVVEGQEKVADTTALTLQALED